MVNENDCRNKEQDCTIEDRDLDKSDVGKGFRNNVGVRNPYALVEHKALGNRGMWLKAKNKKNHNKKTVETYLDKYDFGQLFDPKHKGPLYQGAGSVRACDGAVANWGQTGLIYPNMGPFSFDDPMQGCLANCYFLAALSSVVWAKPELLCKVDGAAWFWYKKDAITIAKKIINNTQTGTSKKIALDNQNTAYYTRPTRGNVDWQSYFEKAYAVFRTWVNNNKIPAAGSFPSSDQPDMALLNFGDPLEALFELSGKKYYFNQTYWTQILANRGNLNAYARLQNQNINGGRVINPTVAWTFYTGDGTLVYDSEIIPANHVYSVLGIMSVNGTNYIILRNPYGASWCCDPAAQPFLLTAGNFVTNDRGAIPLGNDDGIFGITDAEFGNYFEGFGWVQ